MNGPHDMGGMQAFGPLVLEPDEPLFHDPWERRLFGLALAMGATGAWNLDQARQARESLPPLDYLSGPYYRIWFDAMVVLMRERGLVTDEELADGRLRVPARGLPRRLQADAVAAALLRGSPTQRPAAAPARFAPGDAVRARTLHPVGHTRLPRYVRGRMGTVLSVHGAHVYPDAHAAGLGEQPSWLYTVRFDARELWGEDTTAASVQVDAWEPYLESTDGMPAR
jgi:nitrile hydratase beta subunit